MSGNFADYWQMEVSRYEGGKKKKKPEKMKCTPSATNSHCIKYQICWLFALLGTLLHSSHLQKL